MTSIVPDTRQSLILRLPDRQDVAAWDDFASIYEPLVYRLARTKGLQHADAQEVVQEVFMAIARAIDRWEPDPQAGRFRDWLFRISRNLVINYLTRRQHRGIGSGDSRVAQLLAACHAPDDDASQWFEWEERRQLFEYCAQQVRAVVDDKQWQAFWMSSVDLQPIADVAQRLNMSRGAVYIARSRLMNKLRLEVNRVLNAREEWSTLSPLLDANPGKNIGEKA